MQVCPHTAAGPTYAPQATQLLALLNMLQQMIQQAMQISSPSQLLSGSPQFGQTAGPTPQMGQPVSNFLGVPQGQPVAQTPTRSGDGLGTVQNGSVGNLGGGEGADAVRWALTQEGVSERNNPDTVRGYSRGRWQAWCADFVSTAYRQAGGSPFGHQSSVQGILNWGRSRPGQFASASAARSNPSSLRVGDIAVWKQNGRSHVALVTGVNSNGTFNTIEGNTSDRVARRTHRFGDRSLTGFVRPRGQFA